MLAVKLHKNKKPFIGYGAYLIPIINWETGKTQIKTWIKVLTRDDAINYPNNKINYITLVKIPDEHLVFLADDWVMKYLGVKFKPLKEIEDSIKREIGKFYKENGILSDNKVNNIETTKGSPLAPSPELILGERLPESCIKWTKDIRLLYRGDKRNY
jgi:hypothetical protein